MIKKFLEANTDKVSKPLLINKIQINQKIWSKIKNLEKEKESTNNLIDFRTSSNHIYIYL